MSGDVTVALHGVKSRGHHGVFDFERREGQDFVVDAVLSLRRPSEDDDLSTTVDYGALASLIADDVARDPVDLIETLALRLANLCLAQPFVTAAEITVHKPQAPMPVEVAGVSVTVRRPS